jgi:Tat protein secretion system quality control protein TatD with DNase activity
MLNPPPPKSDHYQSIFFQPGKEPNPKHLAILDMLLPYLPDPIPFEPMLEALAGDIKRSKAESGGRIVMIGEIGLDGGARMRWPPSARHLYEEKYPLSASTGDKEEWNRLTPFKVSMAHQKAIANAQMGVAVEMGVNVSFHSVAAAGKDSHIRLPMFLKERLTKNQVRLWMCSRE